MFDLMLSSHSDVMWLKKSEQLRCVCEAQVTTFVYASCVILAN